MESRASAARVAIALHYDMDKNQAAINDQVTTNISGALQLLPKQAFFASREAADLAKLAFWRDVVIELNRNKPTAVQNAALDRFDKLAQDPQFLMRINGETKSDIQEQNE
jgi:hypothetical protein